MKSVSGKEFCKIVVKNGWVLQRVTGSHHIYAYPQIDQILSVPVHRNQDLKVGTLRVVLFRKGQKIMGYSGCLAATEVQVLAFFSVLYVRALPKQAGIVDNGFEETLSTSRSRTIRSRLNMTA